MSTASPPAETGTRIGTLDRGPDEQVRINWSTYNGSPYLSLRLWTRDRRTGHWWPDSKRGLSIRIRELGQVAEAIGIAIDHAEEIRAAWSPLPAEHPARRGAHRRRQAVPDRGPVASPARPVESDQGGREPFDEF
jgi:Transcriptional Coactivator p15 (PC4)